MSLRTRHSLVILGPQLLNQVCLGHLHAFAHIQSDEGGCRLMVFMPTDEQCCWLQAWKDRARVPSSHLWQL